MLHVLLAKKGVETEGFFKERDLRWRDWRGRMWRDYSLFKPPAVALLNNMARREAFPLLQIFSQTGLFRGVFIAGRNSKVTMGGAGGAQRSVLPTSFLYSWYAGASLGTVLSMLSSGIISSTLGWEAIFYIQVHSRENVCMCVAVLFALLSMHSESGAAWGQVFVTV